MKYFVCLNENGLPKQFISENSWWKNMAMIPMNFSQTYAVNGRIMSKVRSPTI
jgi:hypothetical protein